jgi:hypothetical protein
MKLLFSRILSPVFMYSFILFFIITPLSGIETGCAKTATNSTQSYSTIAGAYDQQCAGQPCQITNPKTYYQDYIIENDGFLTYYFTTGDIYHPLVSIQFKSTNDSLRIKSGHLPDHWDTTIQVSKGFHSHMWACGPKTTQCIFWLTTLDTNGYAYRGKMDTVRCQ